MAVGGGGIDAARVQEAAAAEQKANSDRTRDGLRTRAKQATSAAVALAPYTGGLSLAFVGAIAVLLVVGETLISIADAIGYDSGNSDEDFDRVLNAFARVGSLGIPPPAFDALIWNFRGYADHLDRIEGQAAARPAVLDAGFMIKKFAPDDPPLQAIFDGSLSGWGWFFGNYPTDYAMAYGFGSKGPCLAIARVMHLETGADEAALRDVASRAYASYLVASRAVASESGSVTPYLLEAFGTAFTASQSYAYAHPGVLSFSSRGVMTAEDVEAYRVEALTAQGYRAATPLSTPAKVAIAGGVVGVGLALWKVGALAALRKAVGL